MLFYFFLTLLLFDDHDSLFLEALVTYFVDCPSVEVVVFLMFRVGLWVLGIKTKEVKCHFCHDMSRVHTVIMSYC